METMLEDFKYRGEWWNPADPDVRCRGEISFKSANDIILTLEGTLATSPGGHIKTDILVGRIDISADRLVTLIYPLQLVPGYNSSGLETSRFRCMYMVIGKQFQSVSEIKACAVWVRYTNLLEWLGNKKVLSTETSENETRALFVRPEPIEGNIPAIQTAFNIRYSLRERFRSFKSVELTTSASIMLTPDKEQGLEWYLDQSYGIRDLLTLLAGSPTYFEEVLFIMGADEAGQASKPEFFYLYFIQPDRRIRESVQSAEMPVAFDGIGERLSEVFHLWVGINEKLRSLIDLYIGNFFNRKLFREFQFLSYMYCFEIYHRANCQGLYLDPAQYSEYSERIKLAISSIVPGDSQDLVDSLNERIKYGNELALRKRLNELFEHLPEGLFTQLGISTRSFVGQVVDTRNYLTHYSTDLEATALKGPHLSSATEKLRCLILALLLQDLEFKPEEIIAAVSRDGTMNAYLRAESLANS